MAIQKSPYGRVSLDKAPSGKLEKISTVQLRGDGGEVVETDYYGEHKQAGPVLYTKMKTQGGTIWYYSQPASVRGR